MTDILIQDQADLDFGDFLCEEFLDIPEYSGMNDFGLVEVKKYDVEVDFLSQLDIALRGFIKRFHLWELQEIKEIFELRNWPKILRSIVSVVGDDETITANSLLFPILSILVGPLTTGIKISWSDVGVNKNLYNYAEGWILLPPTADSGFESVNRYSRGRGVPLVLDSIKFRDISAVRKQSEMERDLPSKFQNLAERAAWTNRSWFTWDIHQFAMLLGIEVFDFMRSKLFPYLCHSEGGCGGPPPWSNTMTAGAAIMRYRRGRATKGILGIMQESTALFRGELSPQDSFFLRNLYLAMSGDTKWELVRSELNRQRHEAVAMGFDEFPSITTAAKETIPAELLRNAATLRPTDVLTGVAVSYLREKGYIATELDLVLRLEELKKFEALWGTTPLVEVLNTIETRKQEYKEAFLESITTLAGLDTVSPDVKAAMQRINGPMSVESLASMNIYYKMRSEQSSLFNSFVYNDRIRIFKTEDVENFLDKKVSALRIHFAESSGTDWRPEQRRRIELPDETRNLNEIEKWLKSNTLTKLFENPLPPGLGPDDARIARSLVVTLDALEKDADAFLILIVSSDKRLINSCHSVIMRDHSHKRIRIIGLPVKEYLKCMLATRATNLHVRNRSGGSNHVTWLNKQARIFNVLTNEVEDIKSPLKEQLIEQEKFLYLARRPKFIVEYDFPNINRYLASVRYDPNRNFILEYAGGYLSTQSLRVMNDIVTWKVDDIKALPDFRFGQLRTVYPATRVRLNLVQSFIPHSQGMFYTRV